MNYGELSDAFQHSFLGGRFKEFHYRGGNVCEYTDLKINNEAKPIAKAIVIYNQEGFTNVLDPITNVVTQIKPLTAREYADWKGDKRES